jgi:methionyl-tRNA synthetase
VRYFLLREVPFGQDGDVSEVKLAARYESDLANGLGNLVSRVTTLVEKFLDGKIQVVGKGYYLGTVDEHIEKFEFHEALIEIWGAIQNANAIVDKEKLWDLGKTDKVKFTNQSMYLIATIKNIAEKLKPFMPETSQKILDHLAKDKITKIDQLFPRIAE